MTSPHVTGDTTSSTIRHESVQLPHGITLQCRVSGAPGAPLLVFLHGFPEAAFVWDELLAHFSAQFLCVAPNLRGFAHSSAPTEVEAYRAKYLVADVAALIAHFGGHARALVAHDWGGAVAWSVAAQQPALLSQLVILNSPHPATFLRELLHNPAQQVASAYMNFLCRDDAPALLAANGYARIWPFFAKRPGGEAAAPEWLTEPVRAQYRAAWDAGLAGPCNYYRASPLRPSVGDDKSLAALRLPKDLVMVQVPTLVIWGQQDAALLPGLLDGLEDFVPNLQLERVEDASHWIVHEQPAKVIGLIAAALK